MQKASWTECRALVAHGIVAAGITEADSGYWSPESSMAFSSIMLCLAGEGAARVRGELLPFPPGTAYLMPANRAAEYRSSGPWHLAWVCHELFGQPGPLTSLPEPVLVPAEDSRLGTAIQSLVEEVAGVNDPEMAAHHAALVDGYARRIVQPPATPRLSPLWRRVETSLDHPWALDALAREAAMSPELLRLVCHRETGRSPIAHVTHLRLRHAADLLANREAKIATVAEQCGYANPYAFSTAFKRAFGISPRAYRG